MWFWGLGSRELGPPAVNCDTHLSKADRVKALVVRNKSWALLLSKQKLRSSKQQVCTG